MRCKCERCKYEYNPHEEADAKTEELIFDDLMDAIRHSAKWLSHEATVWAVDEMLKMDGSDWRNGLRKNYD